MTQFMKWAVTAALAMALALPAMAAEERTDGGRYAMQSTQDGFLRLDRKTGQVSHCTEKAGDWACKSVADDRTVYEEKIAELEAELADVKAALMRARGELPTDEDLARAFSVFESFAERFSRAARVFKDEMGKMDEPLPEEENGS